MAFIDLVAVLGHTDQWSLEVRSMGRVCTLV